MGKYKVRKITEILLLELLFCLPTERSEGKKKHESFDRLEKIETQDVEF